jgi:hypothetical protein
MARVAYYEEQILLIISKLGKKGEDAEKLRQIAPLFRDNAQATMAACMARRTIAWKQLSGIVGSKALR